MSRLADFQAALESVGVSIKRGMGVKGVDELMEDLRDKWNDLTAEQQQDVANAFTAYMIDD